MNLMSKAGILDSLRSLGKDLAWAAEPMNYSCEKRGRATRYVPMLEACRKAYFEINNSLVDPLVALTTLSSFIQSGIERNHLNLLIEAVKGQLRVSKGQCGWTVNNLGYIVFVEKG